MIDPQLWVAGVLPQVQQTFGARLRYLGLQGSYRFLPALTDKDVTEAVRIGASTLLHLLTHSYLYAEADARPAMLQGAYKGAFFVMLAAQYCASGVYCHSKQELLLRLDGTEKEIIAAGRNFPQWLAAHPEKEAYAMLLHWCRNVLENTANAIK